MVSSLRARKRSAATRGTRHFFEVSAKRLEKEEVAQTALDETKKLGVGERRRRTFFKTDGGVGAVFNVFDWVAFLFVSRKR